MMKLDTHLSSLKRLNVIESWDDQEIKGGEELDEKIKTALKTADIILLLISSDFIDSDYCQGVEVKTALERHEVGAAKVIPIILRRCDWQGLDFGKFKAFPADGKAVLAWTDQDEAYTDIVEGLKGVISSFSKPKIENKKQNLQSCDILSYEENCIISLLPRGFVKITNFDYPFGDSAAVLAHYFLYSGEWMHSTHFHSSYERTWLSYEGGQTQMKKLGIPVADRFFADDTIHLIVNLRTRDADTTPQQLIENLANPNIFLVEANTQIKAPSCPQQYYIENLVGSSMDEILKLDETNWQLPLENLIESCGRTRRSVMKNLSLHIADCPHSVKFLQEASDDYRNCKSPEELKNWAHNFSSIAKESISNLREKHAV